MSDRGRPFARLKFDVIRIIQPRSLRLIRDCRASSLPYFRITLVIGTSRDRRYRVREESYRKAKASLWANKRPLPHAFIWSYLITIYSRDLWRSFSFGRNCALICWRATVIKGKCVNILMLFSCYFCILFISTFLVFFSNDFISYLCIIWTMLLAKTHALHSAIKRSWINLHLIFTRKWLTWRINVLRKSIREPLKIYNGVA